MLGLAEFRAAGSELQQLATTYDSKTADVIDANVTSSKKRPQITATKEILNEYYDDYEYLLYRAAIEAGDNAANYYANKLDTTVPEGLVEDIVQSQYKRKYYGVTLAARLLFNRNRLTRVADKTAAVGVDKLSGILTQQVPFGAQIAIDRRLLLSTMVKVEQDVAKQMAKLDDVPLIRWTLSHMHKQPDLCDDLASHTSRKVEEYLAEREVHDMNPKGLYFIDDLPHPPHPNCQCEYAMVAPGRPIGIGAFKRTLARMRTLFNRIRRK